MSTTCRFGNDRPYDRDRSLIGRSTSRNTPLTSSYPDHLRAYPASIPALSRSVGTPRLPLELEHQADLGRDRHAYMHVQMCYITKRDQDAQQVLGMLIDDVTFVSLASASWAFVHIKPFPFAHRKVVLDSSHPTVQDPTDGLYRVSSLWRVDQIASKAMGTSERILRARKSCASRCRCRRYSRRSYEHIAVRMIGGDGPGRDYFPVTARSALEVGARQPDHRGQGKRRAPFRSGHPGLTVLLNKTIALTRRPLSTLRTSRQP